jgi:hypothetical protein
LTISESFKSLARTVSTFISGHIFGEPIEYRSWPGSVWTPIQATVDREPADAMGQFLRNVAVVTVPRDEVEGWVISRDEVRFLMDARAGEAAPIYTVLSARGEAGHWVLHCEKRR